MNRLFVVYNPKSSRFSEVKQNVLSNLKDLKGFVIGKYEVKQTNVDKNADEFAKVLKNGDLVIAVGGDATGIIASNAILKSDKDVGLAVLPYGNFNDLSHTLGTKSFDDVLGAVISWAGDANRGTPKMFSEGKILGDNSQQDPPRKKATLSGPTQKLYPLEIYADGKFLRYATCYVTIGMMAEAVKLYDEPKMRQTLKTTRGRGISSYTKLASWYFKNRHKKTFLPTFKLNGKLQPKKTSDYAAVNGRFLARVMKGRTDYRDPYIFHSETDNITNFWRLFRMMFRSLLFHVPGSPTKYDKIEFLEPATVELQSEGENLVLTNVKKIEIRKGKKCLKVITN